MPAPATTAAVILAAGQSSRMGEPKQLVELEGRTLLRRAVATAIASSCRPVMVVLGAAAARMQRELAGFDARVVENPGWLEGIGSSVRCGIDAARRERTVDSALLLLCDQPLVTAQLIDQLVAAHRDRGARIVACEYAGTVGVPALFSRDLFDELLALRADAGAKQVIARHGADVVRVPFPGAALDLDTPEDLARARSRGGSD